MKHTPWRCEGDNGIHYIMREGDSDWCPIVATWGGSRYANADTTAHIVKCVNMHDELIEALGVALDAVYTPHHKDDDIKSAQVLYDKLKEF